MIIISVSFVVQNYMSETENQFFSKETITRIFHCHNEMLDYKSAQVKVFEKLAGEFSIHKLESANIYSPKDLNIVLSQEI